MRQLATCAYNIKYKRENQAKKLEGCVAGGIELDYMWV